LGRLADPRAVDTLIEFLSHPNQMLLLATTWALAKIADSRAILPMIGALRRQCLEVQGRTAWGDDTVEDQVSIAARIQMYGGGHANMPDNIATMIARFGESAIIHLQELVHDPDPTTRLYATFALSEIPDPKATESLISQLKDASADVRAMALSALCRIDDSKIVSVLTAALDDSDLRVRSIAAISLNKLENQTRFHISQK
jgi:HEAT repeat protein